MHHFITPFYIFLLNDYTQLLHDNNNNKLFHFVTLWLYLINYDNNNNKLFHFVTLWLNLITLWQ